MLRLEKVTVEEARMAAAEALKVVHGVENQVGDKVLRVHDTLKVVENRMRGVEVCCTVSVTCYKVLIKESPT